MMRRAAQILLAASIASAAGCTQAEAPPPQNTAPAASPVRPDARLVFTYYFYWYDAQTGGHLKSDNGLRYHLPANPSPSWRNAAWHERQLSDMAQAGIDVVLPDYWGFDPTKDDWSWKGLPVLAQ